MSQHTRGPWHVSGRIGSAGYIIDAEPGAPKSLGVAFAPVAADAALVAAAPDLLEALKDLLVVCQRGASDFDKVMALSAAQEAIEKAEDTL